MFIKKKKDFFSLSLDGYINSIYNNSIVVLRSIVFFFYKELGKSCRDLYYRSGLGGIILAEGYFFLEKSEDSNVEVCSDYLHCYSGISLFSTNFP